MTYSELVPTDRTDWIAMAAVLWADEDQSDLDSVFSDLILRDDHRGFICRTNEGNAIGFIYLTTRSDYVEGSSSNPVGYIEGIFVKKEYRTKGIARKLSELGEKWASSKGCTEIASDAYMTNRESRQYHIRIGFQESKPIIHFIKTIRTVDED